MEKSNKIATGRNEERVQLSELVPLKAPLLLNISPGDFCNFKCNYCLQSVEKNKLKKNALMQMFMPWDTFEVAIEQAVELSPMYNIINIQGMGEPLLYTDIVKMVKHISDKRMTRRLEITTNALCLSKKMSRDLIAAGLTRLIVSIQGVSGLAYQQTCSVDIDFEKFIQQIRFFYENKGDHCQLHVKIADTALGLGEENKFFEIFGPYCDSLNIEHTIPLFKDVDYSKILKQGDMKSRYGYEKKYIYCCPMIFYSLFLRPNGDISPCCMTPDPVTLGNVHQKTLKTMWFGNERIDFLKRHLKKQRSLNQYCKGCVQPMLSAHPKDELDFDAEIILQRFDG